MVTLLCNLFVGSGSFHFDCVTNKHLQMWADCYRSEVNGRQNITTNNGVECINRIIKHCVLSSELMKGRIATVLIELIEEYLLDMRLNMHHKVR